MPKPPTEVPTIVTTLWDRCLPGSKKEAGAPTAAPPTNDELLSMIKRITESGASVARGAFGGQPNSVVLEHTVPLRRGTWRLVPEGVENRGN